VTIRNKQKSLKAATAFITGINGFAGCYLAEVLITGIDGFHGRYLAAELY
jgi:GDP-D-mannose dehydratase